MQRRLRLLVFLLPFVIAACEKAGSGSSVSIPTVVFSCQTAACRTSVSNARIIAQFSTSGCQAVGFGATITASLDHFSCTTSGGCTGTIAGGWVGADESATSTIAEGNYSICIRADMNSDYPATTTGDAMGTLDNVSVNASTGVQTVSAFTDI